MTPKHILIVDDEPQFTFILRKKLRRPEQGYSVSVAHSGEEALQKVGEARPDLVLMDIQLPGELNGIETAARINVQFDVPVIYLTAYSDDALLQQAKVAEPYGYLVKPVRDRELYATIEMALYKHKFDGKLKKSEERFRALFQASSDLVTVAGTDGICSYASPSHERLVGHSPDELVGKNLFEFVHPDDLQRVRDIFTGMLLPSSVATVTVEFRFLHKDGSYRWLEATNSNQLDNPAIVGIVSNARDVTERKRAEEARQESEERYRSLFNTVPIGLYRSTPDGQVLDANPAMVQMMGYSDRESFLAVTTSDTYVDPNDRERLKALMKRGGGVRDFEVQLYRYDGTPTWVRINSRAIRDDEGHVVCYEGAIEDVTERRRAKEELRRRRDHLGELVEERTAELAETNEQLRQEITEHKQTEEALRESERRFRSIAETANDAIVIFDSKEKVFYWNRAAQTIFGYRAGETHNKLLPSIIPDRFRQVFHEEMERVVSAGASDSVGKVIEMVGIRKDGSQFPLELSLATWRLAKENIFFTAIIRDITERKQAEEALRRRNRELALLNRAGHAISSSLDLDHVLVTLLEEARHLMDVVACSAWLIDPQTDELVCRQATGPKNERVRGWRLSQSEGLVGWTARHRESLIVPDARTDERYFKEVDQQTGLVLRSILSIPLQAKQRVIGVFQVVDTEVDRFSATDLELLAPLAMSAAVAIENAQLYEEIKRRNKELMALNAIATTLRNEN